MPLIINTATPQPLHELLFTFRRKHGRAAQSKPAAESKGSVLAGVYLFKKEHESALSLDPNDAAACARLGLILNYLGQPARTRHLVEQAMQLNPHYPSHHIFTIGHAEYLMGQYDATIASFKRAVARNPHTPEPQAYLAAVYTTLGQRQEAKAEVADVLRISPNYSIQAARERSLYKDKAILESHVTRL